MFEDDLKRRAVRQYQKKSRGSNRCYRTEIEDLCIMLSWLNGDLSEGQVCKALGLGRVEAREKLDSALAFGGDFGEALWMKARNKRNKGDNQ